MELAADAVPDGAAVRLYSQSFVSIPAIGETPSFKRGAGGASIAAAGQPRQVRVRNSVNLASGDPKPAPASLVFDLMVMPRDGGPRSFAAWTLVIAPDPAADQTDPFASATGCVGAVCANMKSVCWLSLKTDPVEVRIVTEK